MQYLGNCPFLGVSKKMETATGMAMAVKWGSLEKKVMIWEENNSRMITETAEKTTETFKATETDSRNS